MIGPQPTLSCSPLPPRRIQLSAAGVGTGDYVGILLPEGPSQVAAILGTVLAGAAYVPLDVRGRITG